MIVSDWPQYWWDQITGPHTLVEEVAACLKNARNAVLLVPDDLPWRHDMRFAVERECGTLTAARELVFTEIDVEEECPDREDVGQFLLDCYSDPQVRHGFRPRAGDTRNSIQAYIKANGVLKNRILWVKGLGPGQAKLWLDFCREYPVTDSENGLFVLEVPQALSGELAPAGSRSLAPVRYDDCVDVLDVQLFNDIFLRQKKGGPVLRQQYMALLCASLCGTDAEVSFALLALLDAGTGDPLSALAQLAEQPGLSRRGTSPGSRHVLALVRGGCQAELEKKIWEAQTRTLFAPIEMARVRLVRRHESTLRNARLHDKNGDLIPDPLDIDWGPLYFYRYSFDFSPEEIGQIAFLRAVRNTLAHADCCDAQTLADAFTQLEQV